MPGRQRRREVLARHGRLAGAGGSGNQSYGAPAQATAEQIIEPLHAGREDPSRRGPSLGLQTGKHDQAPRPDRRIMVPPHEGHAAHLDDFQPSPCDAVLNRLLIQPDDAMRQALELRVAFGAAVVVDEQHSARTPREELLEGENLPAIAQGVSREKAQLRQGVERHPRGLHPADHPQHFARDFAQLDFCGVVQRVAVFLIGGRRVQLAQLHVVERPPVRCGNAPELAGSL